MSDLGRLVRFEFVRARTDLFGVGPLEERVAFFFDDGLRPVVVRIYQPGRRD